MWCAYFFLRLELLNISKTAHHRDTPDSKRCASHLYVLGDILSLCSRDVCLCVGPWLEPEGHQPADEDDSGLEEALLGTVQRFAAVLLPAHHAVVGLRTHRGHIYGDRVSIHVDVQTELLTQRAPKSQVAPTISSKYCKDCRSLT